jgi:hypothetical protein
VHVMLNPASAASPIRSFAITGSLPD